MKNNFTRNLYWLCCTFILTIGLHTQANAMNTPPEYYETPIEVTLSTEWQQYSFTDGVLIEYKMKEMSSLDYGREVNMVVFRFTNTTNQMKECSWIVKIERNGKCYNCGDLDKQDETYHLILEPNGTAEGNESNLVSHSELNIFGNFVKLVPGMSEEKLTAFELINLTIK